MRVSKPKGKENFIIFLLLFVFLSSCFEDPGFPINPKIEVTNVEYIRNENEVLSVSIYFEDGDGNIGLGNTNGVPDYIIIDGDTLTANVVFDIYRKSDQTGEYELEERPELRAQNINPIEFGIPIVGNINQGASVSGTITQKINNGPVELGILLNYFRDDSLFIQGYMYDLDGNMSNVARSGSFTLLDFFDPASL